VWKARTFRFLVHSVYEEEQYLAANFAITYWEDQTWIHDHLIVASILVLELLASDLNFRIFLRTDLTNQDLIRGCDDLMEGELKLSNEIVISIGCKVIEIVDVIYSDLEYLLLLEFVLDIEAFDPFGVEIVHDDLSHSEHLPHVTFLLVEHSHAICPRKRVKVR